LFNIFRAAVIARGNSMRLMKSDTWRLAGKCAWGENSLWSD